MTYSVTITSTDGNSNTYACAGSNDQEALIYAGKVVEEKPIPKILRQLSRSPEMAKRLVLLRRSAI